MIVLDEQLLGRQVEQQINRWYRGRVVYIHTLRPDTVVKDDAIPTILRTQRQPTFVTINETNIDASAPNAGAKVPADTAS